MCPYDAANVLLWIHILQRETQVVEDVNVEQNVLLRMSIRPETVSKSNNFIFEVNAISLLA